MRKEKIVPGSIILGLFLNLLTNAVWHYLPDEKVYIATSVMVFVCILYLIRGFLAKFWQKLIENKFRIPRKTVQFIPKITGGYEGRWNNGEVDGEPAMQVNSKWNATNLTDENVWILRAYLLKPRTEAMVLTQDPEGDMFDRFPILPRCPTEVIIHLWIQPPICKEGESFKGKIVFIDQFDNKHKVQVTFESRNREGELILSVGLNLRCQNGLNNKYLPKEIRKELKRKGELLSHNLNIDVQDAKWVIKDLEKPRLVYTAKIEDKKLNLYKRFIPPPRQRPVPVIWREQR